MENAFELDGAIESLASKILNKKLLNKVGQLSAFAGVGYGAYNLANSEVGMSVGSAASQTIGNISDEVGYTFNEIAAAKDFEGRAYNPGQRSYDLANQAVNEASAGGVGTLAGAGTTAATFGIGGLLGKMGISGALSSAASATGSAAGTAIGNGVFSAAGGLANAGLTSIGMGGAGTLASQALGYVGGGAGTALSAAGSLAGGMALPLAGAFAAQKAADNFTNQIAYQRQAESAIQEKSYRFTPGMATNAVTGRGLNYRDSADLAQSARESLGENLYMRQGDMDEILQGMSEGELLYNVRGAEEFKDKFEKVTDSLREISRTYEATLEESTEMLGEMRRSGFYTTADQTEMLLQSDAIGRMTGYTGGEVVRMGRQGSQSARQMGLGKRMGYETSVMSNLAIEENVQALSGEERQNYLENIQELGGKEQATSKVSNSLMQLTQRREFQSALFGVLNSEGEIDEEQLNRMLSGDMSFEEAMGRGADLVGSNKEMRAEFYTNARNYFEKLEGPEFLQVMSRMVEGFQETSGMGGQGFDIENTLKTLGIEDQKLRNVIEGAIKSSGVIDENQLTRRTLQEQLREDKLERRSISGVMERMGNWFAEFGRNVAEETGVTEAYTDVKSGILDFFNEHVKDIRTVGEVDLENTNYGAPLSTEELQGMEADTREYLRENASTSSVIEYNSALDHNPTTLEEKRKNLSAMAQYRFTNFTGRFNNASWNWMQDQDTHAGKIFTENFTDTTAAVLANNLGTGGVTVKDENGNERQMDYEAYLKERKGFSDRQIEVFNAFRERGKWMYEDAMSNITDPTAAADPKVRQRQRDNAARTILGFLEEQEEIGGNINAVTTNAMFKGLFKGDYAFQMASGNERAGEVLKGVAEGEGSLEDRITSLFDTNPAENGLSDAELINSIENENQSSILSLGLEYNRGDLSQKEVISKLEDNDLFRDRDLSNLKSLPSDKFGDTLENMLTKEFIDTVVDDGKKSFHMASEEDWVDKWEEKIEKSLLKSHDDIVSSNDKVEETLDRLNSSVDRLDKTMNQEMDLNNLNTGIWNLE